MKNIEDVERELKNLINKYRLGKKLTVKKVKQLVWNESGASAMEAVNKFEKKCFSYFLGMEKIDFEEIANVFMDAWNHFPHRLLEGKAPNKIYSASSAEESTISKKRTGPKIIVGGRDMEWEEYEVMLEEMEKQQAPFRNWIETEVKPKYLRYLETTLAKKTAKKHFEVADIFFERVLHVGFIEFDRIGKAFIQKEFPRWWQTHVLMNNLKEKEVVSSLHKLFEFIEFTYNINIKKFGF